MMIILLIAILLTFAYWRLPVFYWSLVLLFFAFLAQDMHCIIGAIIFATISLIKPIRRLIIYPIYFAITHLNLMPKVSSTEQQALEAGNTWIEKQFFTGKINFKNILKDDNPALSPQEKEFLNKQTSHLCSMMSDWEIQQNRGLTAEVFEYIKQEKFWGMIISPQDGGLGFSPFAQSKVIAKLASHSPVLAITVMVPNSLGPGELLKLYGTEEQKNYYLPRLSNGAEIPCFGLTEIGAGSDAGAITASGELFKQEDKLYIKLNFAKRWITLSNISTIIGLAFKLYDPDNLLGKGNNIGISLALIPRNTEGIDVTQRHDPMGVPFCNAPIVGKDVIISVDNLIGGIEKAGNGWQMLMECLAVGRGLSLPAMSLGGAKLIANITGKHAYLRNQFGMPIGKFSGLHAPLARIAGLTHLIECSRDFTCIGLNKGHHSGVVAGIMKYHTTEYLRTMINDSFDILGGTAITKGPNNLLTSTYMATPVGITVEGANIMTRSLIIFGQGLMRCHPFAYKLMQAINNKNLTDFDNNLWAYIMHLISNKLRFSFYMFTRGSIIFNPCSYISCHKRKLAWITSIFTNLSDLALFTYAGNLKRHENVTGRLGDILSSLYFGIAVIHQAEKQPAVATKELTDWCMHFLYLNTQKAITDLLANMKQGPTVWLLRLLLHINPIACGHKDKLDKKLAQKLQDISSNTSLTRDSYTGNSGGKLQLLLEAALEVKALEPIWQLIHQAVKNKKLPPNLDINQLLDAACEQGVIDKEHKEKMFRAEKLRTLVLTVDSFNQDQYQANK